jgi:hypothetical protein
MRDRLTSNVFCKERRGGSMTRLGSHVGLGLLALALIGVAAGDVVAADRTVLMEYYNATW